MKSRKRKSVYFTSLLIMCGILALVWPSSASAIDIDPIDYGHLNTLTLHVAYAGTDIEGMTYDIYYVATGNEGTSFTLAGAFAGYPVDLTDLTASGWQTAADQLAGYARTDHIAPNATGITDAAGNITFTGLPAGLYLSVGEDLIKGYSLFEVSPFLVALPHLQDDGSWLYDVLAHPKVGDPIRVPEDTPTPTTPTDDLPQTGWLWWPVPLMAVLGLLLFGIGWWRRYRGRETKDE